MSTDSSPRIAYVAFAALLLAVCNGTTLATGQQMLDGSEQPGLIGSMRQSINTAPMQRGPLFIQIMSSEPALQVARMRRDTPQAPTAPSAPSLASISDKLSEHYNKAGQQLKSYGDQILAQIPKRKRRQAAPQTDVTSSPKMVAGQASGEVNTPISQLRACDKRLRSLGAAAGQQAQNLSSQATALVASMIDNQMLTRDKRQISYPSLPAGGPEQAPAVEKSAGESGSGILKYLSNLGQQAQQAQAIQQFISAAADGSGAQTPPPKNSLASLGQSISAFTTASAPSLIPPSSSSSSTSGFNGVAAMMGQLQDLIKSTQEKNGRLLENSQRSLESSGQQTVEAAKSAQGGIQAAFSEMSQGLQRLAANNPSLLPDIKNLYQSVSSKLSPTSTSVSKTASNPLSESPSPIAAQS